MSSAIIVIDDEADPSWFGEADVITFADFTDNHYVGREPGQRVVNMCDTERYLSRGYYCSLLAEARGQKVIPTVSTLNDLREGNSSLFESMSWNYPIEALKEIAEGQSEKHLVHFGWTDSSKWQKLATQIFEYFPSPLLEITVTKKDSRLQLEVHRAGFLSLDDNQQVHCLERLELFSRGPWRRRKTGKIYRWDMAILIDPEAEDPPSDAKAIKSFILAAEKLGIKAETVTAADADQIRFYDALFIRETTAIDHHTYRLAREAEQNGLVVIDDPQSILRCCNKAYLHDAFATAGVPQLKTRFVRTTNSADLQKLEQTLGFPMVLKLPEGNSSKGVYRVADMAELLVQLESLLQETAIVIAQEYCYTEFDWRIGVLNSKPIYACRYKMAKDHWQIYKYTETDFSWGETVTLPTFEAPGFVLDAAVKATQVIGKGLYGVDLKQMGNRVAVIEVNDCPSIDPGYEDAYLGKELYTLIMAEFASRLEYHGR